MFQEKEILWQTFLELNLFLVNILYPAVLQFSCTSSPIMQLLYFVMLYTGAVRKRVRKFALLEL